MVERAHGSDPTHAPDTLLGIAACLSVTESYSSAARFAAAMVDQPAIALCCDHALRQRERAKHP